MLRRQRMNYRAAAPTVNPVEVIRTDFDAIQVQTFRDQAFIPETPLVMRASPHFISAGGPLPATKKWFEPVRGDRRRPVRKTLTEGMQSFLGKTFPYELEYPQVRAIYGDAVQNFIRSLNPPAGTTTPTLDAAMGQYLARQLPPLVKEPNQPKRFLRFHAPLALLNAAINYNMGPEMAYTPMNALKKLYIAQASLSDLPKELQADVPVPRIVRASGKGDIYDSSIWLGLEPIYTPLHRDPNPNLFIQLCSTKVVRLLPPESGDQIYHAVQQRLGTRTGNSRLRGVEMMEGPERDLFFKAIWWNGREEGLTAGSSGHAAMSELESELTAPQALMQEATLEPGDALFIPKGWWHSIKSKLSDGRLNGSVNWWFR